MPRSDRYPEGAQFGTHPSPGSDPTRNRGAASMSRSRVSDPWIVILRFETEGRVDADAERETAGSGKGQIKVGNALDQSSRVEELHARIVRCDCGTCKRGSQATGALFDQREGGRVSWQRIQAEGQRTGGGTDREQQSSLSDHENLHRLNGLEPD